MPTGPYSMRTREFLYFLTELVRQQLPSGLKEFQVAGPTASLVKLHYGNPAVHYEVWIQRRRGEVELGLHFEADPVTNQHHLEVLSRSLDTIRSALGEEVRVEDWTKSWTRAHQTLPLEPLTDDFLIEVSSRLSEVMQTLEPILKVARQGKPPGGHQGQRGGS